jgi:hypothetical protein
MELRSQGIIKKGGLHIAAHLKFGVRAVEETGCLLD